jgi:hypothetical protein
VDLNDLTLHPKIWRGVDNELRLESISTGYQDLDGKLPGRGWPVSAITEIFVDCYGIGELSLLMPALAKLDKHPIIWLAPPYIPYAPALVRFGLDLDRLLFIDPVDAKLNALWALEQVLHWKPEITVLAWIETANTAALRRLQLAVEEHRCWAILFRPMAALQQRSPAALRLRLSRKAHCFQIEILKCRGGRPHRLNLDLPAYSDALSAVGVGGIG